MPVLVGNDVVDLGDPRCHERSRDRRFVERVCAALEIQAVRSSSDPDLALWILWAGKEAAFKVLTKVEGRPPVFEHSRFVVTVGLGVDGLADPGVTLGTIGAARAGSGSDANAAGAPRGVSDGSGGLAGLVTYGDHHFPVRFRSHGDALHALAWSPDLTDADRARRIEHRVHELPEPPSDERTDWRRRLAPRFSEREWAAVHHRSSAWVRIHAREAARRRLGLRDATVEIVSEAGRPGRAPPRLEVEGRRVPLDLSLSHHGRYLAWALADGR